MHKKILILSRGDNKTGPATWKSGLIRSLRAINVDVREINTDKIGSLLQILSIFKYDVIHTFHVSFPTMVYLFLASLLNKKIIFTVHGDIFAEGESKNGLKKIFWLPFNSYAFKVAHTITFPSQFLFKKVAEKMSEHKNKFIIIYNGIDLPLNNKKIKDDTVTKILAVTNFNYYQKARGVVPLIEAVEQLKTLNPHLTLDIVGGGKYIHEFKTKYESDYIVFKGFSENVNIYFKQSDIFVHSTFLDNMPYTILEAVTFQIPVISVSVGAIPEILHEDSIVRPLSRDIAHALELLINNPLLRQKNVINNFQNLSKFSWPKIALEFSKVY